MYGLQFHLETTASRAKRIIEHWPPDLERGPYIQSPEEILGMPDRFAQTNQYMGQILFELEQFRVGPIRQ